MTLPRKASVAQEFPISQMEADYGSFEVAGAQSSFVDLSSTTNKDQRTKQFGRALRVLKLKPYIHSSQLNDKITPETSGKGRYNKPPDGEPDASTDKMKAVAKKGPAKKGAAKKGAAKKGAAKKGTAKKSAEKVEWPQLVMLVKSAAQW
jgi:hypothetical protein